MMIHILVQLDLYLESIEDTDTDTKEKTNSNKCMIQ